MITEKRVMTLLEHVNPVQSLDDLDPVDVSAASYLETLEQRSSEMTQIETIPETKPPGRSRGPLIAAAVAAVLLIATIGILLTNSDEQPAVAPVVPTTSGVVPTTVAVVEGMTTEEALSVADSYVTAFNAADADAILALLTSDVIISDNFSGEWDVAEWEQLLAWNTAQGTTQEQPECAVTDQTPDGVTVRCVTDILQAPAQAVNSTGVATTITMTVTDEGLSDLSFQYGQPDFNQVNTPFGSWMNAQFPEDADAAGFGNWTSIDEAEQYGLLRLQYADEWVSFAIGSVEQTFADFNAGDLDGFLARFGLGTVILDVAPQDAQEVFRAQMTAGTQYTLDQCAPNGAGGAGLLIECELTTTDGSASTSGTLSMRVNAQGTIGTTSITNG